MEVLASPLWAWELSRISNGLGRDPQAEVSQEGGQRRQNTKVLPHAATS